MKKQLLIAAASAALMAIPSLASAGDDQGWYVRGNVGYGAFNDLDLSGGLTGVVEAEGNLAASIGLGYESGNNWRLELDATQLWNDLGAVGNRDRSSADMRVTSGMLNAIYDISGFGTWEPYVGAGIGLAKSSLSAQAHGFASGDNNSFINNPACPGFNACDIKDNDLTLAWQLIAGLGYNISDNLVWDTHYKYLNTGTPKFFGRGREFSGNQLAGNHQFVTESNGTAAHMIMTGLRYRFGARSHADSETGSTVTTTSYTCWDGRKVDNLTSCASNDPRQAGNLASCAVAPPPVSYTTCWDGSQVETGTSCPAQPQVQCSDGSLVSDAAFCPTQRTIVQPTITCWDGSLVSDAAFCPTQTVQAYNACGVNNVAIFNVPVGEAPKSVSRLGTLPEFGDSHGLTPSQFYDKLAQRHASKAFDRQYLDYLFRSMGYSGGFSDAHAGLFSEETLPAGTTGMLGFADYHGYAYSVLNTSERDRQAFRIQGANGTVIHFMKTCGNYMYACQ